MDRAELQDLLHCNALRCKQCAYLQDPALSQLNAQIFIIKYALGILNRKTVMSALATEFLLCPTLHRFIIPRMASTMPSLSTSMDPEQTKKIAWSASPCLRRYSPGAQNEVLMCKDRERRQPRLAEANSDSSRISLLRCMVMSDRSSSGKSFSSCGDDGREKGREGDGERETEEAGMSEESMTAVKILLAVTQ